VAEVEAPIADSAALAEGATVPVEAAAFPAAQTTTDPEPTSVAEPAMEASSREALPEAPELEAPEPEAPEPEPATPRPFWAQAEEERQQRLAQLEATAIAEPEPEPIARVAAPAAPLLPNLHLARPNDYALAEEFLVQRSELRRERRAELAQALASSLRTRLGSPAAGDPERFVEHFVREYRVFHAPVERG
jgi:hypothetical protein